ncbi:extracellular solute-binding protein [Streptomyces sp. NPDC007084]|uniref:extracellular solute-binding protein n=1 Tax=Streptomyces sp. NPDC007084 TaxID=3154313 RepID=UPI003453D16C
MRHFKRTTVIAAGVAVALLATGCGRADEGADGKDAPAGLGDGPAKGKVTMWKMGDDEAEEKTLEALAAEFEKQNPDVDVRITAVPWDAAHEKLTTAIAGGNTPDLAQIGSTWLSEFASMKGLQATPKAFAAGDFFDGQWDTTLYKGTSYGVPFTGDTSVVYYRTDALKNAGVDGAPGADWDTFYQDMKALQATAKKENPELRGSFGLQTGFNAWLFWLPLVWQAGGDIYDPQAKKFTFDSPEVKQALQYYGRFFEEGMAPTDKSDQAQGFTDGVLGALQQSTSIGANLHRNSPELDSKWATMPLPKGKQSAGLAGGVELSVFKEAKNSDAAWKFIRFLSEPKNLATYGAATSQLPAAKRAWEDKRLAGDEKLKAFAEQLEVTKAPPAITTWQQVAEVIDKELEKLAFGKATPEQVQKTLQEKATGIGAGR